MDRVEEICEIVKILLDKNCTPLVVDKSESMGFYVEADIEGLNDEDMKYLSEKLNFEICSSGCMLVYSLKKK